MFLLMKLSLTIFLFSSLRLSAQTFCEPVVRTLNYGSRLVGVGGREKDGVIGTTESLPIKKNLSEAFEELAGHSFELKRVVLKVKARSPGSTVALALITERNRYQYDAAPIGLSRNFDKDDVEFFFELVIPVTGPSLYTDWFLDFSGEAKLSSVTFYLQEARCDRPLVANEPPAKIGHDTYSVECLWSNRSCQPFVITSRDGVRLSERQIGFIHESVKLSSGHCEYTQSKMNTENAVICALDRKGYFRPFHIWSEQIEGLGSYGFGEQAGSHYFGSGHNFNLALEECSIAVQNIEHDEICLPYYNHRERRWGYARQNLSSGHWRGPLHHRLNDCVYN